MTCTVLSIVLALVAASSFVSVVIALKVAIRLVEGLPDLEEPPPWVNRPKERR
jgi:hypothetical protein